MAVHKNEIITVIEKRMAGMFEWGRTEKGWIALRQLVEPLTEEVS
jgi:hypothetical protein